MPPAEAANPERLAGLGTTQPDDWKQGKRSIHNPTLGVTDSEHLRVASLAAPEQPRGAESTTDEPWGTSPVDLELRGQRNWRGGDCGGGHGYLIIGNDGGDRWSGGRRRRVLRMGEAKGGSGGGRGGRGRQGRSREVVWRTRVEAAGVDVGAGAAVDERGSGG